MTKDEKETVKSKIIKAIEDNFKVREVFYNDFEEPIENSVADFSAYRFQYILRKLKGFENVTVSICDSVNDIIKNNFKF